MLVAHVTEAVPIVYREGWGREVGGEREAEGKVTNL